MEDFFAAGGMSAVLRELRRFERRVFNGNGETLGARLDAMDDEFVDRKVIASAKEP